MERREGWKEEKDGKKRKLDKEKRRMEKREKWKEEKDGISVINTDYALKI